MREATQNGCGTLRSGPAERTSADSETRLQEALHRIKELESSLVYHIGVLLHCQQTIFKIYESRGWQFLNSYYRFRERLLPPGSRRRHYLARIAGPVLRGLRLPVQALSRLKMRPRPASEYARWILENEPRQEELEKQRQILLTRSPRFSLLLVPSAPPARFLGELLDSVRAQTYAQWELCVTASPDQQAAVQRLLDERFARDARVRLVAAVPERGPAGSWNAALAAATGEYVALLQEQDRLAPFALFEIARVLNEETEADFLYSDEDTISESGSRSDPHFKPDWSPDTLRSHNYIGRLVVLRRMLVDLAGRFRRGFEEPGHYDLLLRASEKAGRIVHVPRVLYHARQAGSEAAANKPEHVDAGARALAEHLCRVRLEGEVVKGPVWGVYQVRYALACQPKVSVIIPSKDHVADLSRCVESLASSSYANLEILIVENHSQHPETFAHYDRLQKQANVRVLTWKEPFNYSAVNNFAARQATGEVLLFLNNDTQAINRDWLERMLEYAQRADVGAVGAKLYYPDDTVQHAGAIVGLVRGVHYQRRAPRSAPGYQRRLVVAQNLSAVTGACLMTRKSVFAEVGGFDENFLMLYNDLDLCLKIREKGYLIVWTPYAELYHYELVTRGPSDTPERLAHNYYEHLLFMWKWGPMLDRGDPYYNPNLTRDGEDCRLRFAA